MKAFRNANIKKRTIASEGWRGLFCFLTATVLGLAIFPGVDLFLFHILHPSTEVLRLLVIGGLTVLTAGPLVAGAILTWGFVFIFLAEITE